MRKTTFNYPTCRNHYFKIVLDGELYLVSTDVSVTYSRFKKLAESVDFKKDFHDLVHIEVNGDSEVILQAIYIVGL